MKNLALVLLLINIICCRAYKDSSVRFDYRPYARMAIDIMDSLDIPIRPNLKKDPAIKFKITAMNKSGETETKPSRSLDSNIVYRRIKIRISPDIIEALNKNDTTDFKYLFAVGTIIHELVHVFQFPDTIATNTGKRSDFTNRLEVDASSVMTYYLISKTAPQSLADLVYKFADNKQGLRSHLNQFFYYNKLNRLEK
jgi:hypothetical protein